MVEIKLNLAQFIMLAFVFGWVAGDVTQSSYNWHLYLACSNAFIVGYLENAHGKLWNYIKRK